MMMPGHVTVLAVTATVSTIVPRIVMGMAVMMDVRSMATGWSIGRETSIVARITGTDSTGTKAESATATGVTDSASITTVAAALGFRGLATC